jgi:metallo-beta-lactamase class B
MRKSPAGSASVLSIALCLGCGGTGDSAAEETAAVAPMDEASQIAQHLATAKTAAAQDHVQLHDRVCVQAAEATPRTVTAAAAEPAPAPAAAAPQGQQGPPPRSEWYAEPHKVFDNLYFVGQSEYTAWAITTSEGIIIIDPIYDWSVEAEVVEGLQKLGLDPASIEYVVVSHAHRDHVGGARLLQERYGARVVMGEEDWEMVERNTGSWPKPVRDIVAEDGQELTLGETTLRLYITPGHTPTTISSLVPVTDGGTPHLAALWGGTAYNFLGDEDEVMWFREYIASAQRFKEITAQAGADVIISNHSNFDGSDTKLPALEQRVAGSAHPYVVGNESIQRLLTVVEECAKVGLLNVT